MRTRPGVLERALALCLFALALIFGAPVAVAVVVGGVPPSLWAAFAATGAIAVGCGWLAPRLWAGRGLPAWLLRGLWLASVVGTLGVGVGLLRSGKPWQAATMAPTLLMLHRIRAEAAARRAIDAA